MEIVKVQLPIVSNSPAGALVYNEDRSIMQELPLRSKKELRELKNVLGDEPKGYFYAQVEGKGLILKDIAPWQNW